MPLKRTSSVGTAFCFVVHVKTRCMLESIKVIELDNHGLVALPVQIMTLVKLITFFKFLKENFFGLLCTR